MWQTSTLKRIKQSGKPCLLKFRLRLKCTWSVVVQNINYVSLNVNFKLTNLLRIDSIKLEIHKNFLVKRNLILSLATGNECLLFKNVLEFQYVWVILLFLLEKLTKNVLQWKAKCFIWKLAYCYNCGLIKHDWKQTWFNIITFINTYYLCSILYARIWHIL